MIARILSAVSRQRRRDDARFVPAAIAFSAEPMAPNAGSVRRPAKTRKGFASSESTVSVSPEKKRPLHEQTNGWCPPSRGSPKRHVSVTSSLYGAITPLVGSLAEAVKLS